MMKNTRLIKWNKTIIVALLLMLVYGCERDISDDVVATFPNTADIFTDAPVGLTDEFFISFDPAVGANTEGFNTDDNVAYEGSTSIRIDVPTPSDPNGNFIGGIFKDRGEGRDLSGYDALTFWIKGSVTADIEVGFGTDFEADQFPTATVIELSTNWRKVIIPIPDASRLTQEKGMFFFSAGSYDVLQNDDFAIAESFNDNIGYTFWMDEMRFENLGTIGQRRPNIFNGVDEVLETFSGSNVQTTGISYTVNLPSGVNQTSQLSTNYFTFNSSNPSVATVSDTGLINVISEGEATITASVGNQSAQGSLTIIAGSAFVNAPDPTEPAANVTSIYSDFYAGVSGLNIAIFNNSDINIETQTFAGNQHIVYENLAFVGLGWDGTEDVSGMSHLHLDVQLTSAASTTFVVELIDFGADQDIGGSDNTAGGFNATNQLMEGEWVGIDIPLNAFTLPTGGGGAGSPNLDNIGSVVLVSNSGSVLIDNVYFYNQ